MIKITRRIPNFIDRTKPPEEAVCETTEELLEVDWVKKYSTWPEFNNYCVYKDGKTLMIENKDGTWWWVVGYLEGEVDLPVTRMVRT